MKGEDISVTFSNDRSIFAGQLCHLTGDGTKAGCNPLSKEVLKNCVTIFLAPPEQGLDMIREQSPCDSGNQGRIYMQIQSNPADREQNRTNPHRILAITVALLVLSLLIISSAAAENLPVFSVIQRGAEQLEVQIQGFNYPSEITPLIGRQPDGSYYYIISSSWSWRCNSSENMFKGAVLLPQKNCTLVTKNEQLQSINSSGALSYMPSSQYDSERSLGLLKDWKMTYDGIFGHTVIGPPGSQRVLAVRHNEHQNSKHGDQYY
jgi:hypothetical protein